MKFETFSSGTNHLRLLKRSIFQIYIQFNILFLTFICHVFFQLPLKNGIVCVEYLRYQGLKNKASKGWLANYGVKPKISLGFSNVNLIRFFCHETSLYNSDLKGKSNLDLNMTFST